MYKAAYKAAHGALRQRKMLVAMGNKDSEIHNLDLSLEMNPCIEIAKRVLALRFKRGAPQFRLTYSVSGSLQYVVCDGLNGIRTRTLNAQGYYVREHAYAELKKRIRAYLENRKCSQHLH